MKGNLTFTKAGGESSVHPDQRIPLEGAEFIIRPDGAAEDNIITGIGNNGVITSGSNGVVIIPNLPIGTYWILEKTPPAGYLSDTSWHKLEIRYPTSVLYAADDTTPITQIINTPGYELPHTGGPGDLLLKMIGTLLILLSTGVLLFRGKKD